MKIKYFVFLGLVSVAFSAYAENCVDFAKTNPSLVEVFECFQRGLDSQQKRIAELEKENETLRRKTDAISVSSDGNVGIGTTNPKAKLHLKESGLRAGIRLESTVGKADTWDITSLDDKGKGILIFVDVSSSKTVMALNEDGNVGIGTTPTEKLQVAGNIKATAFKTGDIYF